MSDHALSDIIAVEKEIQAQIRQENEKVREWLESECRKIDEQSSRRLARHKDQCRKITEKAEKQARIEADKILNNAERYKSQLEGITENRLAKSLRKYLPTTILPEVEP